MHRKPIIIGLTGSIGTGKTTVSRFLRRIGFPIFDADDTVKQILQIHQPTLEKIRSYWPFCFDTAALILNKKKLAHHVFAYLPDLEKLESIVHPQIEQIQEEFIKHFQQVPQAPYLVIESPLLFETQTYKKCNIIVVTTCTFAVQKRRVLERPGMTETLFDLINARQMPDNEKQQKADHVIDTTKGIQEMVKTIRYLLKLCSFENKKYIN